MLVLRARFLCLLLPMLAFGQTPTPAPPPSVSSFDPHEATRGQTVTIAAQNLKPGDTAAISLKRSDVLPTNHKDDWYKEPFAHCPANPDPITAIAQNASAITFQIPANICLGNYEVSLSLPGFGKPVVVAGSPLVVTPDDVHISAVHPSTIYFKQTQGESQTPSFDLVVVGDGFSPYPEENSLVFVTRDSPLPCFEGTALPRGCNSEFHRELTNGNHELRFTGIPTNFQGHWPIRIRVGNKLSDNQVEATFSQFSSALPTWIASLVVASLIAMTLFLVASAVKQLQGSTKTNFLSALFIDPQTQTYSLSMFQFYVWTFAAIFGYAFLTSARSLIQGRFEFSDIPDGLPGILLASAGTAVLSTGITANKGTKGAGDPHPTLGDFITSGGTISADRLQFFVWTLVGVASFILLILRSDPGTITNLPKIPTGFLELMGISSMGYLGGKLARKPGPTIDDIVATVGGLNLGIFGAGLSGFATFQIDDVDLPTERIANPDHRATIKTPDETAGTGFARTLEIKIDEPDAKWLTPDEHRLTITNPDSQRAVSTYAFAPQIERVDIQSTTSISTLIVVGSNFHAQAKITWLDSNAIEKPVQNVDVVSTSEVHFDIPDAQGQTVAIRITNPSSKTGTFSGVQVPPAK